MMGARRSNGARDSMPAYPPWMPDGDPSEMLSAILQSSDDAIIGEGVDGVIASWNPGAQQLFGYSAAEAIGQPTALLLPPGSVFPECTGPDGHDDRGRQSMEMVCVAKGGRPVDVSITLSPIRNRSGRIVGRTIVARGIEERLRTEQALRTTEARWRAVIDSAVDAIVVIDARGVIQTFNRAAERMFGYTEAEAVGRNVALLMPAPHRDDHDRYIEHYLKTGEQKIIGIGREVVAVRQDGSLIPVHLSVGEMQVGTERHFTGILHDLSERTRLEERLREQSALVRLGEMGAVIAHEVRNPLAAVRGAIQVVGGRLPADGRDAPVIKEILARLDALNNLLDDLLLFARTPEPRFAPVSLAQLVQLTVDLLADDPVFRDVRIELDGDSEPIMADAGLLKIVFQNLLINAAQAMRGSGVIRTVVAAEARIQRVSVTDSGPGVPTEIREKLFTPFFTTKARGTGLGLSTAKRLVEIHGGSIAVECPHGGGTVVTVDLPVSIVKA
jgi:two-component system sensor kinase FixL